MKTQSEQIAKHLESGKSITPIEALNKFGCFRLGEGFLLFFVTIITNIKNNYAFA